jgi:hypothetical protein
MINTLALLPGVSLTQKKKLEKVKIFSYYKHTSLLAQSIINRQKKVL